MTIERGNLNNEVQNQELQELRRSQIVEQFELAHEQGENLEAKDSLDIPDNLSTEDTDEDNALKRETVLDEKNSIDSLSEIDESRRFEDYSNDEICKMQEEDPYKLANLNADFRERYEADMYGMSQEEYRDYKDHLNRINQAKDDDDEPSADESKFDLEADKSRIAERQDAFAEKYASKPCKDKIFERFEKHEYEKSEMVNKVKTITDPYYNQSGELARNNKEGRVFTDHKQDHVSMVADKSLEAGDAIKEAVEKGKLGRNSEEGRIALSAKIDKNTLEGSALSHDTGMRGDGYALTPLVDENGKQLKGSDGKKMYEKDADGNYVVHKYLNADFNEIRNNHSLNSAINLLENREKYKDAGYSDEQVDKMAAECMAHSKSSSGVSDLNSKKDWSDCFDRIDAAVCAYNEEHPDSQISFDRSSFENNDSKLGSLASETLALRVGDVSRDSFDGAEAQSGESVYIVRSTINNHAGSIEGELEDVKITIGENGDLIDNLKSRQVHVGEQNIVDNHSYVNKDGEFTHEITVADGASAPRCTQEAINDHLGELASAKDERFNVMIQFDTPCDEFSKKSYESYRLMNGKIYGNVEMHFPWDKEEQI